MRDHGADLNEQYNRHCSNPLKRGFCLHFKNALMLQLEQVPGWEPVVKDFVCTEEFNDLLDPKL